jgi:hypothetical protein
MQTVTLEIQDSIYEKFIWLLKHFSKQEINIVDSSSSDTSKTSEDDEYLRNIDGMVDSIKEARKEENSTAVTLEKLDW